MEVDDIAPRDSPKGLSNEQSVGSPECSVDAAGLSPRYTHWYRPEDDGSRQYWEAIIEKYCASPVPADGQGQMSTERKVFAVGGIVIRVDVNQERDEGAAVAQLYSWLNSNEYSASRQAKPLLEDIGVTVPVIYFYGAVRGRNVTVESRVAGESLDKVQACLQPGQVTEIRLQCAEILHRLALIESPANRPSYFCSELNARPRTTVACRSQREHDVLFNDRGENSAELFCFTHNDLVPSNIIVRNARVVGLVGWRQSGYFGFQRAQLVHEQFRVTDAARMGRDCDVKMWTDLYDFALRQPQNKNLIASGRQSGGLDSQTLKTETSVETDQEGETKLKTEHPSASSQDAGRAIGREDSQVDTKPETSHSNEAAESLEHYIAPKQVSDLRLGSVSRRDSSSERSSPAPSMKSSTTGKKKASGVTKKGTATKKTPGRKRKLADVNGDADASRQNTPVPSHVGRASGLKKEGSLSVSGSPVPEKKKGRPRKRPLPNDEDYSDGKDEVFCICRKPDNHTWMIACDGGCEDWFHGKCVNIDPRDADLIEKYICPACKEREKGCTIWKPMCRLPGCRKPARVNEKRPSKYCSDDHGREFMRRKTSHLKIRTLPCKTMPATSRSKKGVVRANGQSMECEGEDSHMEDDQEMDSQDDNDDYDSEALEELGSRGGVLTAGELKAVVAGISSAKGFRNLGNRLISPPPEEEEEKEEEGTARLSNSKHSGTRDGKKLGLDVDAKGITYSVDEAFKINKLRKTRDELVHRREMLGARSAFIALVRQRSKSILERLKQTDPKGGWKDICGFDRRLAWSDEEFDEWRLSETGMRVLKDGTSEDLAASYQLDATDVDGDVAMTDENEPAAALTRGVCIKKRCERHKQWVKVQQQDILFEEGQVRQELINCEREAQAVVERAALRTLAERN